MQTCLFIFEMVLYSVLKCISQGSSYKAGSLELIWLEEKWTLPLARAMSMALVSLLTNICHFLLLWPSYRSNYSPENPLSWSMSLNKQVTYISQDVLSLHRLIELILYFVYHYIKSVFSTLHLRFVWVILDNPTFLIILSIWLINKISPWKIYW